MTDDELAGLRRQIDDLDRDILNLLSRRMEAVQAVGQYKQVHGIEPLDSARWQAVLETRLAAAKSLQLSEAFVTSLYQLIHEYALEIERQAAHKAES